MSVPTRPALRYYGGKWRLAPWIISNFPAHDSYIDVFGGAANIILRKERSLIEVYNDLDHGVVTFFRVLRDRPDELIRKIRLTPWARDEYDQARSVDKEIDELELARRFWARSAMSISSMGGSSGMRIVKNVASMPNGAESWNYMTVDHLEAAAMRFRGVQIESKDYRKLVRDFDYDGDLLYFDPPYVAETRVGTKLYAFEWANSDHAELFDVCQGVKGFAIVSGYACDLYQRTYEAAGWKRIDRKSTINGGGSRTESLWISPRTKSQINNLPIFREVEC